MIKDPPVFKCCFCGTIVAPPESPTVLTIPWDDGSEQDLYCHLTCLRKAVHPSVPLGL